VVGMSLGGTMLGPSKMLVGHPWDNAGPGIFVGCP
jgi:hypothetical protein